MTKYILAAMAGALYSLSYVLPHPMWVFALVWSTILVMMIRGLL